MTAPRATDRPDPRGWIPTRPPRHILGGLLPLLLASLSMPGLAVELANGTLTSGGGIAGSDSYSAVAAIGQPVTGGVAESESYRIAEGIEHIPVDPAESVPGDLTGDGGVDADDFMAFLGAFGRCDGQAGYLADADYDGDACITFIDYQTWYGHYLAQGG